MNQQTAPLHIAVFIDSLSSSVLFDRWKSFLEGLRQNSEYIVHPIVRDDLVETEFRKMSLRIKETHNLNSMIKEATLKGTDKKRYQTLYLKHSLWRLKQLNETPIGSLGARSIDRFEKSVVNHIVAIENFFLQNNIVSICLNLTGAHPAFCLPIFEAVAKEQGVGSHFIQNHGYRYGVYDCSYRTSKRMTEQYYQYCQNSLNSDEKSRVEQFRQKLLEFQNSTANLEQAEFMGRRKQSLWKSIGSAGGVNRWIKKKLFQKAEFLVGSMFKINPFRIMDAFDYNKSKYVLFLPNKKNNYRVKLLAPFHSDSAFLVKILELSMPIGHSLVVKDHPSSILGNPDLSMLKQIRELERAYYIDPELLTTEVIEQASIVTTVASSSVILALALNKHVVVWGSVPFLFPKKSPPVKIVGRSEDLPAILQECLNSPPPSELIDAFLCAFIEHTIPWSFPEDKYNFNIEWDDVGTSVKSVFHSLGKHYANHLNYIFGSTERT